MLNGILDLSTVWPYAGVLTAAALEGEVAYIAAATLVAAGRLNAFGVCACGAIGAAIGDQAYFYLCRGRVHRWLSRHPAISARAAPLVERVRRDAWLMVLLIRFAPGLRIAIAVACALADVRPVRFTVLNFCSAVVWAAALLVLVSWLGPAFLDRFGVHGWQAAACTGVLLVALVAWLGRIERRSIEGVDAERIGATS